MPVGSGLDFAPMPERATLFSTVTTGRGVNMSALGRLAGMRGGGEALKVAHLQQLMVGRRRVELRTP
jgi:hypothetical protein